LANSVNLFNPFFLCIRNSYLLFHHNYEAPFWKEKVGSRAFSDLKQVSNKEKQGTSTTEDRYGLATALVLPRQKKEG